jgi:hypothetical protein
MNFSKQIIVFISAWLILPIIMIILNIPFRNLLLIGIPVIFSFYNFIKAIIEKNSTNYFVIGILFLLIGIKIEYHFYNWVIHIILIIACLHFLRPFDNLKTDKLKFLGVILIGINIIFLVTSNSWILNQLNYGKKPWSTNLEWNDFQGIPEEQSELDAIITTTIYYKENRLYNYPNAVISSYMVRNESWQKEKNNNEAQKELLNHEKGHFNILEAHVRFAQDSLKKAWGISPDKIEEVIEFYLDQKEIAQKKYDSETQHGVNIEFQGEWDELIKNWLE